MNSYTNPFRAFFFSLLFLLAGTGAGQTLLSAATVSSPAPLHESYAYKQFAMRTKNELSKLIFLIDRYKDTDYKVVYNGIEYGYDKAVGYGRKYLARHYRKENAEDWIKVHAYRSQPEGEIIYLKAPDQSAVPLRDALLEELKKLNEISGKGL